MSTGKHTKYQAGDTQCQAVCLSRLSTQIYLSIDIMSPTPPGRKSIITCVETPIIIIFYFLAPAVSLITWYYMWSFLHNNIEILRFNWYFSVDRTRKFIKMPKKDDRRTH